MPTNTTPDRVVNISLGGSGACGSTMQNAINAAIAAGTLVVVAAGNSNVRRVELLPRELRQRDHGRVRPATRASRAYYSNYGSTVEIAAPGGDAQLGKTILSTLNAGTTTPGADSYANYQGTSMATPHVVGVAALVLSSEPEPDAGPGDLAAPLERDAVPVREHVLDLDVRLGHRQRRRRGRGRRGRRHADPAGHVREDVACQPCLDLGHVGDAAVGRELRRGQLRVLPRPVERHRL